MVHNRSARIGSPWIVCRDVPDEPRFSRISLISLGGKDFPTAGRIQCTGTDLGIAALLEPLGTRHVTGSLKIHHVSRRRFIPLLQAVEVPLPPQGSRVGEAEAHNVEFVEILFVLGIENTEITDFPPTILSVYFLILLEMSISVS